MEKGMNKKGQGLSTNAIILIVLGVIVLVILAVGFIAGWDKIAPWINPTNNVQVIAEQCALACTPTTTYNYCTAQKELKDEEGKTVKTSCAILAKVFPEYGIKDCNTVTCDKKECTTLQATVNGGTPTPTALKQGQACPSGEVEIDNLAKLGTSSMAPFDGVFIDTTTPINSVHCCMKP